ncbi:MAG: shikimate dehydrogenase [Clostridiales bacterium]|nr:shikimate dehydrogenase [Clostridiales bacterium]
MTNTNTNTNIINSISGSTKIYGVIGDPIGHSFSPEIHNAVYSLTGERAVYVPFNVKKDGLEAAVKGAYSLGIKGLNVTLPHKKEVIKYLRGLEGDSGLIGAVNTLKYTEKGYIGYNTDVTGIEYSFSTRGISLKDRTALVLGAGGASDALCAALLKNGAKRIYIANRTFEKALALKELLEKSYNTEIIPLSLEEAEKVGDADIVLNGTTLGFGKNSGLSPLSEAFFSRNRIEICFDVIYTPWETRLLKDAKEAGAFCINGFDMLIYQGAASAEIWLSKKYDESFLNKLKNNLKEQFLTTQKGN